MNAYINIYKDHPTAGEQDGTLVSMNGTQTNPLGVTLNAIKNEKKIIKCAIRCNRGYNAVETTKISFSGTNWDKWEIAADENFVDEEEASKANFGSELVIKDKITTVNTIFWIRVSATDFESPIVDTSVSIKLESVIAEVETE